MLDDVAFLAAGDNILSKRRTVGRATAESLGAAVARFTGQRGRPRIRRMVPLMIDGSESPRESKLRHIFMQAGIPELTANLEIYDRNGIFIARPDLQNIRYRVVWDYEGDHHRTDIHQWRKDLGRVPRLEDEGWHSTRVSAADLDDPRPLIARALRNLRERGWSG